MTDPPAIDADAIQKEYGDVRALDGLSLTVRPGEFFGLLGPNGAGKTTFIKTLLGLVEPTGGSASVFGHDVRTDQQAVRARVSAAPQEYKVDRFFPIHEVLEHAAGYHGLPRGEATAAADRALEQVGLAEKRDQKFHHLSGGMKRRLLLARALVTDPDLLILDEPTAGVDVTIRRDIWDVIRRLNDEGTTVLLTTHYIEEAERLCDRVCILNEGRKVETDTPAELRRHRTDTLHVDLADPPADLSTVRSVPDVASVIERPEGLTARVRGSGTAIPDVITALDRAGHAVEAVDIERASLEDAFVDLTGDDGAADTPDAEDGDRRASAGDESAETTGGRDPDDARRELEADRGK